MGQAVPSVTDAARERVATRSGCCALITERRPTRIRCPCSIRVHLAEPALFLGCFLIDARFNGWWPHSGGPALVIGSSRAVDH